MEAETRYPGRAMHWIRGNAQERMPSRWIVADSESVTARGDWTETQTLRLACATRWRTDVKRGEQWSRLDTADAADFWAWVAEWCARGHRTVLWFHNAGHDIRILGAFEHLPELGFTLEWCNLDRNVSVMTWRSSAGTLVIADTYTWLPDALAVLAPMTGIPKPRLPRDKDSDAAWLARCRADVDITEQLVRRLLAFIQAENLGNWQPSGAGMGYNGWRHRFMTEKVLVHDDAEALAAERTAMHTGRAEAWWHGKARGGPFTEFDMSMSYPRIAAECAIPVKIWHKDSGLSRDLYDWSREAWAVLAEVEVTTKAPLVPARHNDRIYWPVGTFTTILWDPEIDLLLAHGARVKFLRQWRYVRKAALRDWARWSIGYVERSPLLTDPVAAKWVKHQARAVIGRFGLRNSTWTEWGENPLGITGLSTYLDIDEHTERRMMHFGNQTFIESERREGSNSLPQITGWIMSEARARLWAAMEAAGLDHVLHVDTDSLIVDGAGAAQLRAAIDGGLPGAWRPKDTWRRLEVTAPRHYRAPGRRVIPGVPRSAVEAEPGVFTGQVWESVSGALEAGQAAAVTLHDRTWRPGAADFRRPGGHNGPSEPIALPMEAALCSNTGPVWETWAT